MSRIRHSLMALLAAVVVMALLLTPMMGLHPLVVVAVILPVLVVDIDIVVAVGTMVVVVVGNAAAGLEQAIVNVVDS